MSAPLYATTGSGEAVLVEKKSRFIGALAHTETEEEARRFIAAVSANHRDASHNVYCYLLRAQNTVRFSDDGEPQGTAGRPALEVLTRAGVTDCCLVVTRYFGGTLLGANGLVRAYAASAAAALGAAGIYDMLPRALLLCRFTYADWARAEPLLRKAAGVGVGEPEYGGDVVVPLDAPPEAVPALKSLLMEKTAGRVAAEAAGERLAAVRRDED